MNRKQALEHFFSTWEELESMPKTVGRPSMERTALQDRLMSLAGQVRSAEDEQIAPKVDAAVEEYRSLHAQIAAIAPKDTRGVTRTEV